MLTGSSSRKLLRTPWDAPGPNGADDAGRRCDVVVSVRTRVIGASNFLLIGAYLLFSRPSRTLSVLLAFAAAGGGLALEAASRVYLGYHWFTDTLASASISVVLLAVVIILDISRGGRAAEP
jgi:hypothetical protein